MPKNRESEEYQDGNEAAPDEMGNDPREVGSDSAGQSGDAQRLSITEDADNESVEELDETDQALEAATVEGLEDAADHPERPVHTHVEYGRPDDLPPARFSEEKRHRKQTRLMSLARVPCYETELGSLHRSLQ